MKKILKNKKIKTLIKKTFYKQKNIIKYLLTDNLTNYIISIIFFLFLFSNSASRKIGITGLIQDNEAIVTILTKGEQKILGNEFNTLPDSIYINGIPQAEIKNIYNLTDERNVIRMIWTNTTVTSFLYMFHYCISIISIDLSKFSTNTINNMERIFCHCHSLEYLNLDNVDTSNVIYMRLMFSYCYKLPFVNLSHFVTSTAGYMTGMFL